MQSNGKVTFDTSVASVLLDAVRGFAALLVCMHHLRYLFFVDYPQIIYHRGLLFLPYLFCSMGHQAVIIFFVMSGYLVGGHVLRALDTGRWSWRAYLLQRGVRLWIVLLPALILGGLYDFAAIHLHLAPGLYAGQVPDHITYNVHAHFSVAAFLGNCLFVQSILTPVFGSNGALWSLANEFWYYLLFPLGLLALRRFYTLPVRFAMALGCIAVVAFLSLFQDGSNTVLPLFPVWMLGVLLAIIPTRATSVAMRWIALALYAPFCAVVERGHFPGRLHPDYALGLATFVFLWVILGAKRPITTSALPSTALPAFANTPVSLPANAPWYVAPSRAMAGFSYTLYLVHTPLLMLLAAFTVHESRWTPDIFHLGIAFVVLLATVLYGYGIASVTEMRTPAVRDWLKRRLLPGATALRPPKRLIRATSPGGVH